MSLVDDVRIKVAAGNGGNGASSKKQVFGSKKIIPDGGNGGNGGSIYFKGDHNTSDLSEFKFRKELKASAGTNGKNKDLDGANGEDLTVKMPFGTTVTDVMTGDTIEILNEEPVLVARGGRGGIGNHDYKLNLNRLVAPNREGTKGEEKDLHLVLNLIADIGLVGKPNAGKSSLLQVLTNAIPKIGDYPFTTTEPNLGVIEGIVLADIPGLIEGASRGKGLGHTFLKHIQKTVTLLHLVSAEEDDVIRTYESVREELQIFDEMLVQKNEVILLTKTDLADREKVKKDLKVLEKSGNRVIPVSIYDEKSLDILKKLILETKSFKKNKAISSN